MSVYVTTCKFMCVELEYHETNAYTHIDSICPHLPLVLLEIVFIFICLKLLFFYFFFFAGAITLSLR